MLLAFAPTRRAVSRTAWIAAIVVIVVAIVAGVGGYYAGIMSARPAAPSPTPRLVKVVITSGSTGGSMYLSTSAELAAIGNIPGVYFVHQAGSGTLGVVLLVQNKTDIGVGAYVDTLQLWKQGHHELRALLPVAVFPGQMVVRKDSDIRKWSDVTGKKISIGAHHFIANKMFRDVMSVLNIKPAGIRELGHRDSMELLVSGDIDAYFFTGFPNPTVQEFCVKYPLRLVAPTSEELTAIKKNLPQYIIFTVDATQGKVYHGVDIKYDTPAVWVFHYVKASFPTDLAYKIVKAYWEHIKIAGKMFPQHKWFTPEIMFKTAPIPLHCGVVKYFKEKGVSIPSELIPPECKP